MRKILVLRGGALGDFIVTLPMLALLRERWPGARIELAGNATAARLARARGLLDEVHSQHEARWASLFGNASLPSEFAAWLAGFDQVLSYWPDPDGELRRRFPLRAGQTFLSAPAMPTRAPAAAHFCEPLRTLGLEPREYFVPLAPVATSPSERIGRPVPLAGARSTIAVHPGSGSPRKNWPRENWVRLIPLLPAPVSLILGDAELPRWSPLSSTGWRRARPWSWPPRADSTGREQAQALHSSQPVGEIGLHLINAPLEDLVGHLAGCRLFLGHDSGISHLAAACGARCVLLFGPTDPAMWAPPTPNVRVLRRGTALEAISIEDVRQAAATALADQS